MKLLFLIFLLCGYCFGLNYDTVFKEGFERANINQSAFEEFIESSYLKDHSYLDILKISFIENVNIIFNSSIISQDCIEDMKLVISTLNESITDRNHLDLKINLTNTVMVNGILPMIDSTGKIPNGILLGNLIAFGLKSECQNVYVDVPNRSRPLEGAYGRVSINIPVNGTVYTGQCTIGRIFTWDICVPKSCESHSDMLNLVRSFNISKKSTNVSQICDVGTFADNPKMDFRGYIVGILMLIIVLWSIIASIVDIYIVPILKSKKSTILYKKSFKLMQAMSLYTNIKTILKLPKKPTLPKDDNGLGKTFVRSEIISSLHCIRVISIIWVMMGHCLGFVMVIAVNPKDMVKLFGDYSKQYLPNAFFSVDSFFFMSGLLLSFMFFKSLKRNRRRTLSINNFIMMYAHRIIRLSPSYYMAVAFYTWVFAPNFINNMAIYILSAFNGSNSCNDYWWTNFLYINNYVHVKNQCYLISWYLATDLQIFLFCPIILIPLALNVKLGLIVSVGIIALSTAVNIFEVFYFYFPPSDFSYGWMDPRMKDYTDYTEFMYNAPWIRCQIYIIGMLVGYFLQMKKSLKIPFFVNILGWIVSLIIMVADVISIRDWASGLPMDLFPRAMYSAFSKIGWGISLSFIVISCFYGHGGIINRFMSWPLWSPLGKITYSTYLIHLMVITYVIGGMEDQFIFVSVWNTFIYIILPIIILSFFFSFIWCAIFEVGVGKIEDLLLDRRGEGKKNNGNPVVKESVKIHDEKTVEKINDGWRYSIFSIDNYKI
ncbi:Acyltransferase 3 domain and Nose resistant-to-fluoxetine protein, N-terminal domain-containing protein [Strongyloides ratti]|uniref:Acyltransferase 3 domain and Nose resistant-to-fluoxetine protein, N-terminal domain-containing protein n=1 Tax=Strongyloides ratti TaxID=34506 RepID=A0A090L0T2_STRRB|nr:Acyltransferase 3 domain and Nose resistant-to-fluoxetine protein, N-terminal domain-containing protein [Strongyloides ratti]CEF63400.1 Acyltransferase 3 domain and Nose resistant-to-fluoxetine protein, N-terminal domain-containing protein [Strongyloides ratti]